VDVSEAALEQAGGKDCVYPCNLPRHIGNQLGLLGDKRRRHADVDPLRKCQLKQPLAKPEQDLCDRLRKGR